MRSAEDRASSGVSAYPHDNEAAVCLYAAAVDRDLAGLAAGYPTLRVADREAIRAAASASSANSWMNCLVLAAQIVRIVCWEVGITVLIAAVVGSLLPAVNIIPFGIAVTGSLAPYWPLDRFLILVAGAAAVGLPSYVATTYSLI